METPVPEELQHTGAICDCCWAHLEGGIPVSIPHPLALDHETWADCLSRSGHEYCSLPQSPALTSLIRPIAGIPLVPVKTPCSMRRRKEEGEHQLRPASMPYLCNSLAPHTRLLGNHMKCSPFRALLHKSFRQPDSRARACKS